MRQSKAFTPTPQETYPLARFKNGMPEVFTEIAPLWRRIADATTQGVLNAALQDAEEALASMPGRYDTTDQKAAVRFLSAAYNTHLWRIRHGSKTFD